MCTKSSWQAPGAACFALGLFFAAPPAANADQSYDTFVQAVAIDRSDQVRALLARGMDPNTLDPNGDPVLLVAARAGWQPTVDALLGAGAKVDLPNRFGDRPITVAALGGHLAIVKTLFTRGAALDGPGWTPLLYAASGGQTEVARYLLDAGANVNAVSPNGTTRADDGGAWRLCADRRPASLPRRRRQPAQRKRCHSALLGGARRVRRDCPRAARARRDRVGQTRRIGGETGGARVRAWPGFSSNNIVNNK